MVGKFRPAPSYTTVWDVTVARAVGAALLQPPRSDTAPEAAA